MDKLDERIHSVQKVIKGLEKYENTTNLKPMIDHSRAELDFLQELKQRRESDIRSAAKFLGNSQFKQLCHITSELLEVWVAWFIFILLPCASSLRKLVSEVIDVQGSCQTMLEGPLRLNKNNIKFARIRVLKKNHMRCYDKVS